MELDRSAQIFSALSETLERSRSELLESIQRRQAATEQAAQRLTAQLELEVKELERRRREMEQLLHTDDRLLLLQVSWKWFTFGLFFSHVTTCVCVRGLRACLRRPVVTTSSTQTRVWGS